MLGKSFTFFHGWVEDIQPNPSNDGWLLKVRQDNAGSVMLTLFNPNWPLEPGNEVSVAVHGRKPSHAIALVDHSAGNGAILPCPDRSPNWEDAVISAALLCLILSLSGWRGLPVFALLLALYWLTTAWLPGTIRRRDMSRIGYLIDRDYRHWLDARDSS